MLGWFVELRALGGAQVLLWRLRYGPSLLYRAQCTLALVFLPRLRFCVDRYTWSPTWYGSLAWHFLLAWNVCWMRFAIIMSWATIRSHFTCYANCLTPLNVVSNEVGIPIWCMYPWFSSNGANPVVLTLLFSTNSTIGHLSAQFFWSSFMIILRIWPIERFPILLHHPSEDGML